MVGHCYGVAKWRQIDFEWIQKWSKLKIYTKTNQIKIYWSWIVLKKKGKQTKFCLIHRSPAWEAMRNVQASQARDRQQKLNRGKMSISALTRKKHLPNKLTHFHHHQYKCTPKSISNVPSGMSFMQLQTYKPDITFSVRLYTNIKQIKTYTMMAVTWVRINYWIQQNISIQCAIQKPFLYHIQIRLQEQRQTGTRQVFISTKHILLALSERAMDFYIHM